jgi:hypothetical protein
MLICRMFGRLRENKLMDNHENVCYTNALVINMRDNGHNASLVIKGKKEVTRMLERVLLTDLARENKKKQIRMAKEDKITFIDEWTRENKLVLAEGGLLDHPDNHVPKPLKFVSAILFSVAPARLVVPLLQKVFQADACHMQGKYTIYIFYGGVTNIRLMLIYNVILT